MIVTAEEMRKCEDRAFKRGVTADELMEQAAAGIVAAIRRLFPSPGWCELHFGKGNNGGDVLAAGRQLRLLGWRVSLVAAFESDELGELPQQKLSELKKASNPDFEPLPQAPWLILDGLLGIGITGSVREPVASAIHEINCKRRRGAYVISADIPSGLNADTGEGAAVEADMTVTIGHVKKGLLADEAASFTGQIEVVELAELAMSFPQDQRVLTRNELAEFLPRRSLQVHKGTFGRIAVLAGSHGYTGAARLCSEAAVAAGGGLVTLFADQAIAASLTTSCLPEAMVRPTIDLREVLDGKYDVIAIGPGLGRERDEQIREVVAESPSAMVVDADALNAVASKPEILTATKAPRLLTPHPGEMQRLLAREQHSREGWAKSLARMSPQLTVLLKGARTVITNGRVSVYNSTGNPGMASGGMGDVLTGIAAAMIAQAGQPSRKEELLWSAALAAWLHGRAADIYAAHAAEEPVSASGIISQLPAAFADLRARPAG